MSMEEAMQQQMDAEANESMRKTVSDETLRAAPVQNGRLMMATTQ